MFSRIRTTEDFWAWFAKEADRLKQGDPVKSLNKIGQKLNQAHPGLRVGIQLEQDSEAWRLDVSCEGVAELIPLVQQVTAAAPRIPGWTIAAFRQPMQGIAVQTPFGEVSPEAARFSGVWQGEKFDVALYLGQSDGPLSEVRLPIAFMLMDHTIGEYLVMTKIGEVHAHPADAAPPSARPLTELAAELG
jgi:hypothetical protein